MSKPLKEDYIIRIKSRIEQRLDEPAAEEEKEEFVELMTRGTVTWMRCWLNSPITVQLMPTHTPAAWI